MSSISNSSPSVAAAEVPRDDDEATVTKKDTAMNSATPFPEVSSAESATEATCSIEGPTLVSAGAFVMEAKLLRYQAASGTYDPFDAVDVTLVNGSDGSLSLVFRSATTDEVILTAPVYTGMMFEKDESRLNSVIKFTAGREEDERQQFLLKGSTRTNVRDLNDLVQKKLDELDPGRMTTRVSRVRSKFVECCRCGRKFYKARELLSHTFTAHTVDDS